MRNNLGLMVVVVALVMVSSVMGVSFAEWNILRADEDVVISVGDATEVVITSADFNNMKLIPTGEVGTNKESDSIDVTVKFDINGDLTKIRNISVKAGDILVKKKGGSDYLIDNSFATIYIPQESISEYSAQNNTAIVNISNMINDRSYLGAKFMFTVIIEINV